MNKHKIKQLLENIRYLHQEVSPKAFFNGEYTEFKEGGYLRGSKTRSEFAATNFHERKQIFDLVENHVDTPCKSLELGCGYGRHTPYIHYLTQDVTAIDPNPTAIDKASGYYSEPNFVEAKVQDLPFEADSFGFVFSWTVLQHIPPAEIETAISEIRRVTKNGAILILAHTVSGSGDHWWGRKPEEYEKLLDAELIHSEPKRLNDGSKDDQDRVSVLRLN